MTNRLNHRQMNRIPPFDPELLARYDRPGPRYTSYPTAPQFISPFGETQLREQASRSNQGTAVRPLSLYLHIPFCQSPCFYCGCNRVITRDQAKGIIYLQRLQREIALVAPLFDPHREVVQLHLGGGTPNFLRSAHTDPRPHRFRCAHPQDYPPAPGPVRAR